MDLRFLESLIAVVDHGAITAAARAQGVTPAAVSQRIQVLERDLGCVLLDRAANRVRPSRICEDLLPDMRDLVARGAALRGRVHPERAEGELRLGAISTMLTGSVPGLLRQLQALAPGLELRIEPGSSAALFEALRAGALDAALIVDPPFGWPPGLRRIVLREEPLKLLLPPEAAADQPLAELFRDWPQVAYDPRSWGGQIAARYLLDHGIEGRPICAMDGLEAIADLVAGGIGVALVPGWAGLEHSRVRQRDLPDGAGYLRRIVLALPAAPERPAAQGALLRALGQEGAAAR